MRENNLPENVKDLFDNPDNEWQLFDYENEMNNYEALEYFCDLIGCKDDNYAEFEGSEATLIHPDYNFEVYIDSSGLGDFFSHKFETSRSEANDVAD